MSSSATLHSWYSTYHTHHSPYRVSSCTYALRIMHEGGRDTRKTTAMMVAAMCMVRRSWEDRCWWEIVLKATLVQHSDNLEEDEGSSWQVGEISVQGRCHRGRIDKAGRLDGGSQSDASFEMSNRNACY